MHGFFGCVSAPFYPPDQDHQSYSHIQHLEGLSVDSQNLEYDQQDHDIHVHLSCHSGYGASVIIFSCLDEKVVARNNTFTNLEHTPPVPPPNSV